MHLYVGKYRFYKGDSLRIDFAPLLRLDLFDHCLGYVFTQSIRIVCLMTTLGIFISKTLSRKIFLANKTLLIDGLSCFINKFEMLLHVEPYFSILSRWCLKTQFHFAIAEPFAHLKDTPNIFDGYLVSEVQTQ